MRIEEIERLVGIARAAGISELAVSAGGSSVRIRKAPSVSVSEPSPAPSPEPPKRGTEPAPQAERARPSVYITAPMVGVFHSIDSLSAVGSPVRMGQVVGMIESMKLLNDVISEHEGIIAEILTEDGTPVEYGQLLFRLDPL